jgi:hypothetical protein
MGRNGIGANGVGKSGGGIIFVHIIGVQLRCDHLCDIMILQQINIICIQNAALAQARAAQRD